ncbi:alkaline phosphatase [Phycisphaerales bacterium AB-hyl4]|uniref:Alkaline phosphatase n=1 Tax=Natronomicrosphaera hydrolytica TaxID=3242702 RepID=A0ABV4U2L2_9BACT
MAASQLSRREALKLATATTAAFCGSATIGINHNTVHAASSRRRRRPRNIIFMVSDGMSMSVPTLTDSFARIVRGSDQQSHWTALMTDIEAVHGLEQTFSLNSLVTDSAAAASAWGSGSHVANGAVNMLPDGTKLTPIVELVKQSGRKVGLVTTTRVTHATPAGFAAIETRRTHEDEIAPQYRDVVDVLLGGGLAQFDPKQREDKRDLLNNYKQSGYSFWSHRDQLLSDERPKRVLGLFADNFLPYTLDQAQSAEDIANIPTLAEMTAKAIQILNAHADGFLVQIEGGRVDHAAHGNDAGAMFWDQLAFDDAIGVALNFARQRDDTLVIITSDHGTANPALNGWGSGYIDSNEHFARLANVTGSFNTIVQRIHDEAGEGDPDADLVADVVKTYIDMDVSTEHAQSLANTIATGERPEAINQQMTHPGGVLGQIVGNHTGIHFTGHTHTADHVICSAYGPGSERFAGLRPNTDDFRQIMDLFEIDYQNPSRSPNEPWRQSLSFAPRRTKIFSELST